ncbi:MAG: DUF721 domain-containing protein [Candidatus Neomarinimicrobiota bacterium]
MKNIRVLVEELFRNLNLESIPPGRKALVQWNRIAGKRIADCCDTPSFNGDRLVVRTESPAAAMELKYRSSEIVSALNREAGQEVFRSLKVIIRPAAEQKKG